MENEDKLNQIIKEKRNETQILLYRFGIRTAEPTLEKVKEAFQQFGKHFIIPFLRLAQNENSPISNWGDGGLDPEDLAGINEAQSDIDNEIFRGSSSGGGFWDFGWVGDAADIFSQGASAWNSLRNGSNIPTPAPTPPQQPQQPQQASSINALTIGAVALVLIVVIVLIFKKK